LDQPRLKFKQEVDTNVVSIGLKVLKEDPDIDEIQAEDEEEEAQEVKDAKALDSIRLQLQRLQKDLDNIKKVAKI
jgi:hypothetical protein